MLAGSSRNLLESLGLEDKDADDFNITNNIGRRDGVKDYDTNAEMLEAFKHLGFTEAEVFDIQKVVAAVLHLGNVAFKAGDEGGEGESSNIVNNAAASEACRLIGIDFQTLERAVCFKTITVVRDKVHKPLNIRRAQKSLEALMKALYSSIFDVIVSKVNRSIKIDDVGGGQLGSISVLDIFGFESFKKNSFEQVRSWQGANDEAYYAT